MKKALFAATVTLAMLTLLIAYVHVEKSFANWYPPPKLPQVTIWSPDSIRVYSSSSVLLNISMTMDQLYGSIKNEIVYSLDDNENETLSTGMGNYTAYSGTLSALSDGTHNITVYGFATPHGFPTMSAKTTLCFKIDTEMPIIQILSIQNETYDFSELPIKLVLTEQASWIAYCLDNQPNQTIIGNETMIYLTEGSHTMAIYANDTAGNMGKSETISFSINLQPAPTPSPIPSPTLAPTIASTNSPSQEGTYSSEFSVSLSESASALNYGNTVNFTVSINGGVPPYNFTWYVDGSAATNTSSPYYQLNSMPVGSHHVYVEVKDANGDSATTLTVEFNVLPTVSPSSSPTQSPTAEPTQSGTPPPYDDSFLNDNVTTPIIIGLVALAVLVGVAFVLRKHHKETKK